MTQRRSVFVAIPAYDRRVDCTTLLTLFQASIDLSNRRGTLGIEFCLGNPCVQVARNILVGRFLETDCTDLFFMDSDIGADTGAIMRMIDHPVDLVCGLYPARSQNEQYMVSLDPKNAHADRDPKTGLIKIVGAPGGFMRIRRHVIEKMVDACDPDSWFVGDGRPNLKLWPLFDFTYKGHQIVGEDVFFCMRWRELGGEVWGDPDIMFAHTGAQTTYGRFADFQKRLRASNGKNPVSDIITGGNIEDRMRGHIAEGADV